MTAPARTSGELYVLGASEASSEAQQRAVVLAVLRRVEIGRLTPSEARTVLAHLGLLETAAGMRALRHGLPVEVPAPSVPRCKNGLHELTPDNIRFRSDGGRQCKRCVRDAENRRRAAKKGAAA